MMRRRIRTTVILAVFYGVLAGALPAWAGEDARWSFDQTTDEQGNIVYDFKDVEVKLPADWNGKYDMETRGDYLSFYHSGSREGWKKEGNEDGGHLFAVVFSENYDFVEYDPAFQIVGRAEDGIYYISYPTDVQGYVNDDAVCQEWSTLMNDVTWISFHLIMRNWEGNTGLGDYILPESDSRVLENGDITGMNVSRLQMAINEIFARHGRKFTTPGIQEYFDGKTWYEGTVEAEKFDEDVFSEAEKANIALLQSAIANPPLGVERSEYRQSLFKLDFPENVQ